VSGLWLALGFLTRLPARAVEFTDVGLRRALFWFPLVGLLLGALWSLTIAWLVPQVGQTVGAWLLLVVGVLLTGALHLDGVADTFDGLSAANAGPERALTAMRDSRIGAHGACALVLVLLGKFAAFSSMHPASAAVTCLFSAVGARWACALVVAWAPPARSQGLGATFRGTSREGLGYAGAGVCWLGVPLVLAVLQDRLVVVCAMAIALGLMAAWLLRAFRRAFGGVTGDTHGAMIEVCETALLLVGAVWGPG
jgi:adenosylcobinamide-GDP ribazoletransferase